MRPSKAKHAVSRRLGADRRSGAELVTLIISLALLLALVGGLAWVESRAGQDPPHVTLTADWSHLERAKGRWYLPVEATNDGDLATDWLRISVTSTGEPPKQLEWEYVPAGGSVTGTAVFAHEPSRDSTTLDVESVTDP